MLFLVASPTELTTAATDLLLGLIALVCLFGLRRERPHTFRNKLWQLLFATLTVSSLLGAVAHGVQMSQPVHTLLWLPLYFLLALTVSLLVVIGFHDLGDERKTRRFLPYFMAAPFIVVVLTWIGGGHFIWFILFEAAAMLFALVVYSYLCLQHRVPGAGFIVVGVVISISAAALQASGPYTLEMIWLFDHNGLFHLVQIPGVVCFYKGAVKA